VLVVLGVLVVIGLAVAFIRRRREEASVASDAMAGLDFEPRPTRAAPAMSPATKARDRDSFLVEDSDEDTLDGLQEPSAPTSRRAEPAPTKARDTVASATVSAAAAAASPRLDETMSSETQVRFDQQDALAEADFHMAYGLYDQAADLVKIAIEREPARRDLKLKLLEIYFVWGNKDLFLDTARELHGSRAQAAPGEWDKVLIMGKQIAPDDAMFKGEAGAAHVDLVDVNLEGGENRVDVDCLPNPMATSLPVSTSSSPAASARRPLHPARPTTWISCSTSRSAAPTKSRRASSISCRARRRRRPSRRRKSIAVRRRCASARFARRQRRRNRPQSCRSTISAWTSTRWKRPARSKTPRRWRKIRRQKARDPFAMTR
jgi:hypothetical protein